MGIGDPASPVASDVELGNPVPRTGMDDVRYLKDQLARERARNGTLSRQIRILYETLAAEGTLSGDYTYPPP